MALHILPSNTDQGETTENIRTAEPEESQETLAEQLRQERLTSSILRANAEQARRVADCTRTTLETLLLHLDQPYAVVDKSGTVTQWNDRLAEFSGIEAEQAVGPSLQTLLDLPLTHALARELDALTPDTTYRVQTPIPRVLTGPLSLLPDVTVAQITLVPLCRVPGSLEAMILLFRPD